jgi:radical SAM superfamily enzyme YgiQ (UPF0313 family)
VKIGLVIPRNVETDVKSFYDYKFIADFIYSKKYFSYLLAIPLLISLTPETHEIRVFDENIGDIDFEWGADLIGISVRTMYAQRAYHIADRFRQHGVKTVLGGIHPSMCTEEALDHCDAVVIGEAENVWQKLLLDAEAGCMKRTYNAEGPADLTANAVPDRSKLARSRYFSDIVQTTKGCPFECEFCSVHVYDGQRIRHKSIDQVIDEIKDIQESGGKYKKKSVFFADDNIIANKKFAEKLFRALKPYQLNWSCQASINIAKEDDLLRLMKESGCGAILVGLESISQQNLSAMGKKINLKTDYHEAIAKIQSHEILVHGSFIVGYDFDTPAAFDELIEFIETSNLLMPLINILTPFPGTKLFRRLEKEGRILHKNWKEYDSKTVVYRPATMTPEELAAQYRRVIRRVYSFDSIYRKLKHFWQIDFWKQSNRVDLIKFRFRLLFALRLCTLLFSMKMERSKFILKLLPKVFCRRVRISTILTLMAYNDYAYGG